MSRRTGGAAPAGDPGPAGLPSATGDTADRPPGVRSGRTRGPRDVLVVAGSVVAVVLGAAALTSILPTEVQHLVFHTPLAIGVLVAGTVLVLWRAALRRPPAA